MAQTRQFNVAEQPASRGIPAFARQASVQILASGNAVAGRRTNAVRGTYTVEEGLRILLQGTGLAADGPGANGIITIRAVEASAVVSDTSASAEIRAADERDILVTGTRIRGARPSSPVVTITQEDMRLAGHNNLGEAIRALPQNFSGGQNPGVAPGATAGSPSNQNVTGSSSLNLRGLGPDASLTLLNGSRLPYDGFVQAADLSVIPAAAIDRVEILLDGASAIYGSDAVGGVANIILRRDYRGVELSARYGLATDGGYEQQQYTALAGTAWESGGFLVTGDFSDNTPVRVTQRDYLSYLSFFPAYEIYPRNRQYSGLFSGHHKIGGVIDLAIDGFYTRRTNSFQTASSATVASLFESRTSIWGIAPSLSFELQNSWNIRLHGMISQNVSATPDRRTFSISTGETLSRLNLRNRNRTEAVGLEAEGRLFPLPGGDVRLSLGGGWRRNFFENRDLTSGAGTATPNGGGSDNSYYGYGEVNIPIVSAAQEIALINRFVINTALRHENYDSFGGTTTPKIGAVWSVVPGLDLRLSWGRSFKVPTLLQQYSSRILYLTSAGFLGGDQIGAPPEGQGILQFGGNQDLEPERAETISAGFTFNPSAVPGLNLELNWFRINYRDRIIAPITIFNQTLTNPAYANFVTLIPTTGEIAAAFDWADLPPGTFTFDILGAPYDPAKVFAVVAAQYTNAAADLLRGVDVSARYGLDALGGRLTLNANGSWISEARRRASSTSPPTAIAGSIFFPATFRGRLGASWTRRGFTLGANIGHISGVIDTNVTPNVRRESMTTTDLVMDNRVDASPIGAFRVSLSVMNLFDEAPPFAQPAGAFQVNYDSTNYSALGRLVSLTLTKQF
jgi:outer membrane receptor protein involved in Fe transport